MRRTERSSRVGGGREVEGTKKVDAAEVSNWKMRRGEKEEEDEIERRGYTSQKK